MLIYLLKLRQVNTTLKKLPAKIRRPAISYPPELNKQKMKKTIWRLMVLNLLWLCGMAGCQEKTENASVPNPVLSTSNMMMPLHSDTATAVSEAEDAVVFVCKSAGAKRYHFKNNCRGLKRCKYQIEQSSLANAENIGLTLCGYEK